MTNYEKNKALLDVYAIAGVPWSVNKAGKIIDCAYSCYVDCIFDSDKCALERLNWIQQEYKEPEVDWSKVEVDTPILVKRRENAEWRVRYFAGYINKKVCAFADGKKSEDFVSITFWNYAKLAKQEEEE